MPPAAPACALTDVHQRNGGLHQPQARQLRPQAPLRVFHIHAKPLIKATDTSPNMRWHQPAGGAHPVGLDLALAPHPAAPQPKGSQQGTLAVLQRPIRVAKFRICASDPRLRCRMRQSVPQRCSDAMHVRVQHAEEWRFAEGKSMVVVACKTLWRPVDLVHHFHHTFMARPAVQRTCRLQVVDDDDAGDSAWGGAGDLLKQPGDVVIVPMAHHRDGDRWRVSGSTAVASGVRYAPIANRLGH